jgi:hypothetical protein
MAAQAGMEEQAEKTRIRKPVKVVDTDEEITEDALLGEATLAKLSASRKPEEVPQEKADQAAEGTEEKAGGELSETSKDDGEQPAP